MADCLLGDISSIIPHPTVTLGAEFQRIASEFGRMPAADYNVGNAISDRVPDGLIFCEYAGGAGRFPTGGKTARRAVSGLVSRGA